MPAEPRSTRSLTETLEESSQAEGPTEKDESQKSQARTLEGNTAPHCEHVFVTDEFCAADASTPVRREHSYNTIRLNIKEAKNRYCCERDSRFAEVQPRAEPQESIC